MDTAMQRRKFFIHPSSQLKYIVMSVVPAIFVTFACAYFLLASGEMLITIEESKLSVQLFPLRQAVNQLQLSAGSSREAVQRLRMVRYEVDYLEDSLKLSYYDMVRRWSLAKLTVYNMLAAAVIGISLLALIISHRVAGPLLRVRRCLDLMSEGKDVPPVRFRYYDEFKEVGEALEALRSSLKGKGFLK